MKPSRPSSSATRYKFPHLLFGVLSQLLSKIRFPIVVFLELRDRFLWIFEKSDNTSLIISTLVALAVVVALKLTHGMISTIPCNANCRGETHSAANPLVALYVYDYVFIYK